MSGAQAPGCGPTAVAARHGVVVARRARCPASSANLGPGFDALALALALYIEVEVRPAATLSVRAVGEGATMATDASHLAARIATAVAGTDGLEIVVRSEIPVARGLGSSAALAAAAAAAAGSPDALGVATMADGHPENAAASLLGGLVAATMIGTRPIAARLVLDPALSFVVVVPDRPLPTPEARGLLPGTVAHGDAAFNLGRMGMLVAGLADRRFLVAEATQDRLHQGPRTALFPEAPALLAGLERAGALASCWSGAGPSLLAICDGEGAGAAVQRAAEDLLAAIGVAGRSLLLGADTTGLVTERL